MTRELKSAWRRDRPYSNPDEQRERYIWKAQDWKGSKFLASCRIGVEVASSPVPSPPSVSKTQFFLTVPAVPAPIATQLLEPLFWCEERKGKYSWPKIRPIGWQLQGHTFHLAPCPWRNTGQGEAMLLTVG